MIKIPSVMIGIPAYNEEQNISSLVHALFQQSQTSWKLLEISILNDGSTDKTRDIILMLQKKYPKLVLAGDTRRKGVRFRLTQFFKASNADILLMLDADMLPQKKDTLDHLLTAFRDQSVGIASARLLPIPPRTKFERLHGMWRHLWDTILINWKDGKNVYLFRGSGIAIRQSLAKNLELPSSIHGAVSHYLYLYARSRGHAIMYDRGSVFLYRLAATEEDYLHQASRGGNDAHILANIFPTMYQGEYAIPNAVKYRTITLELLTHPVRTILGLIFRAYMSGKKIHSARQKNMGTWESIPTTKSVIQPI